MLSRACKSVMICLIVGVRTDCSRATLSGPSGVMICVTVRHASTAVVIWFTLPFRAPAVALFSLKNHLMNASNKESVNMEHPRRDHFECLYSQEPYSTQAFRYIDLELSEAAFELRAKCMSDSTIGWYLSNDKSWPVRSRRRVCAVYSPNSSRPNRHYHQASD